MTDFLKPVRPLKKERLNNLQKLCLIRNFTYVDIHVFNPNYLKNESCIYKAETLVRVLNFAGAILAISLKRFLSKI